MKDLSADGNSQVDASIRKGAKKMGTTPVFLVDKEGNLLNTEPLCVVYEDYHSWFIGWLQKKFREEKNERNAKDR